MGNGGREMADGTRNTPPPRNYGQSAPALLDVYNHSQSDDYAPDLHPLDVDELQFADSSDDESDDESVIPATDSNSTDGSGDDDEDTSERYHGPEIFNVPPWDTIPAGLRDGMRYVNLVSMHDTFHTAMLHIRNALNVALMIRDTFGGEDVRVRSSDLPRLCAMDEICMKLRTLEHEMVSNRTVLLSAETRPLLDIADTAAHVAGAQQTMRTMHDLCINYVNSAGRLLLYARCIGQHDNGVQLVKADMILRHSTAPATLEFVAAYLQPVFPAVSERVHGLSPTRLYGALMAFVEQQMTHL